MAERLPAVHVRLRAGQSRGGLQWSQRYLQWSAFPRLFKRDMPSAISYATRLVFIPIDASIRRQMIRRRCITALRFTEKPR